MDTKIIEILNEIEDDSIKLLLANVVKKFQREIETCPAACSVHQAYEGGLLDHLYGTTMLAAAIADRYKHLKINRDIVIAGAFLHDIGKIACYETVGGHYRGTPESSLFHHITIGFHLVHSVFDKMSFEDRPSDEKINGILHIIVSHHGRKEYSSPRIPATDEARIVSSADFLDAYLNAEDSKKKLYGR